MRTTHSSNEIALDTFQEQASLLPVLEAIAFDEDELDRAQAISLGLVAARGAREAGNSVPKPFRITPAEAADLVEVLSTDNTYLEYFIDYAKTAIQSVRMLQNSPDAMEWVQQELESACLEESARQAAHLALTAMVEATQESAGYEAMLIARPKI